MCGEVDGRGGGWFVWKKLRRSVLWILFIFFWKIKNNVLLNMGCSVVIVMIFLKKECFIKYFVVEDIIFIKEKMRVIVDDVNLVLRVGWIVEVDEG